MYLEHLTIGGLALAMGKASGHKNTGILHLRWLGDELILIVWDQIKGCSNLGEFQPGPYLTVALFYNIFRNFFKVGNGSKFRKYHGISNSFDWKLL